MFALFWTSTLMMTISLIIVDGQKDLVDMTMVFDELGQHCEGQNCKSKINPLDMYVSAHVTKNPSQIKSRMTRFIR